MDGEARDATGGTAVLTINIDLLKMMLFSKFIFYIYKQQLVFEGGL